MEELTKITINSDLDEILRKAKLPISNTKAFLLCKFTGVKTPFITQKMEERIKQLGLYTEDEVGITWNFKLLFHDYDSDAWVNDYIRLFSDYHKLKWNDFYNTRKKLSDFLKKNPEFSPEEILLASKKYLSDLPASKYALSCVGFIRNGRGSKLLDCLRKMKKNKEI